MKIFALAGALGLLAGPALAEPTLAERLAKMEADAAEGEYLETSGPFNGSLREGESARFRFLIAPGYDFIAMAACDQDCSDLDLQAFDLSGTKISEDVQTNALPALSLVTEEEEPVIAVVSVIMAKCRVAPCAFTLKVWGR